MAGQVFPISAVPVTSALTFPALLDLAHPEGLGFPASLSGDAIWRLFFRMPPTLPTGTGKLLIVGQANATSGTAKLNVKWKSWGANEVPLASSLTAEGVADLTFATTAYRLTELKVTMDADTFVGGELVQVDLVGETSSWTLAQVLALQASIIFE